MTRAVHTSRRRFWRRQGSTRAAFRSIAGALVAPPQAGKSDTGLYAYGDSRGPGCICGIPRRRRGRGSRYGWGMTSAMALGRGCGSRPSPRAMVPWLPPAAYRRTINHAHSDHFVSSGRPCRPLPVQRLKERRNWSSGSPINKEIGLCKVQ